MNPKRPTPRHVIIRMPKVKDKENLKSSKRKAITYKEAPIRLSADSHRTFVGEKVLAQNIQSNEKQEPTNKIT